MERRYIAHGLLIVGGQVLLLRRGDGRYLGGMWDIPGGSVEPGEEPDAACVREFLEETSLDVTIVRELIRQTNLDTEGRAVEFETVTYLVRARGEGIRIEVNASEHDAYEWVAAARLKQRPGVVWHVAPAIEAWERLADDPS